MPIREEMRSLAEEIVGSYADRVAGIAELRETVKLDLLESRRHIEDLRDSRITTGKQMRADLTRSVSRMKSAVSTQLKEMDTTHATMSRKLKIDLAKGVGNRKHEVGVMLDGFGQAHSTMSKEMRANLARSLADCRRSTGAMLRSFSAELKEVRSELAGGRDEWQILISTLQAQRVGAAVAVKPPEAVAVPAEEITEEEVSELTPETADISGRTFEYLANHPDGTKLVELEQEFGLTRIEMARLLKDLMGENKVEKRELLYFAI